MILEILEMLNILLIVFIFLLGVNLLMYWCLRVVSEWMEKKYKWVCPDCGDILKSHIQPFCKPCSHIDRTSKKMDKI